MRYSGDRGCGGEEAAKVGQLMVADEDDGGDERMTNGDKKGGRVRRRRRCGGEDGVEMTCGGWWPEVGRRLARFREERRGGG
ncbi:hypothetical protein Tco_0671229 [Tanacetum coccineum]